MTMRILLGLHVFAFVILAVDLVARYAVLRRLDTPKEKRASTRRLRLFSKAPVGLAYLTILVTGSIMTAQLWKFTDAWILGGIVGYMLLIGLTKTSIKLFGKTGIIKPKPGAGEWWGRLMGLAFIVFSMTAKPSWGIIPFIWLGFLIASVALALAATSQRQARWRLLGVWTAILVVISGLCMWQLEASKLPDTFSIMQDMSHTYSADMVSVEQLIEPASTAPVKEVSLAAEETDIRIGDSVVSAWTYNGTSPGPTIRAKVGERLRVTLTNKLSVPTSIHWHGVAVPNAQDGVAGVTQDAVQPGEQFVYEFTPKQAGTYWYHSHQDPAHQVDKGLFGAFIVEPADTPAEQETLALAHTWHTGDLTINGQTNPSPVQVTPGQPLRLRLINSDSTVLPLTVGGATFKVMAFDSGTVNQPGELSNVRYDLAGAGRMDIEVTLTAGQELDVRLGDKHPVTLRLITTGSKPSDLSGITAVFNPLTYGSSNGTHSLPGPVKTWHLAIDEGPGFYDGRFGQFYTIDGKRFPHGPMLMVRQGQTYEVTFVNRSKADHPMHLHGHVFQVMSIDNKPSSGSPLLVDNVNVAPHQTVTIRFTADNPGIWMSHCHNLMHAFDGMDLMVAYENVMTPYMVGGEKANRPE